MRQLHDVQAPGVQVTAHRGLFDVIPVTPHETSVLGRPAYKALADVPRPVDIVDVFRRAEDTPGVADEAVAIGAKVLWLQLGIVNDEAARRASADTSRIASCSHWNLPVLVYLSPLSEGGF